MAKEMGEDVINFLLPSADCMLLEGGGSCLIHLCISSQLKLSTMFAFAVSKKWLLGGVISGSGPSLCCHSRPVPTSVLGWCLKSVKSFGRLVGLPSFHSGDILLGWTLFEVNPFTFCSVFLHHL